VASSENGEARGRKRERSSSLAASNISRLSSSRSPASSNRKRPNKAPFRNGTHPSGKPKASDYEDDVKRRLIMAMSIYETYIFTNDAYPSQEKQGSWAEEAWEWASENLNASELYELSQRMKSMVGISISDITCLVNLTISL